MMQPPASPEPVEEEELETDPIPHDEPPEADGPPLEPHKEDDPA